MKVHILATVRKEELLPATTMVFKTLRTGFPTAHVSVYLNGDPRCLVSWDRVRSALKAANADYATTSQTIHHDWITHLLSTETEPFWICDTDMVFWKSVEDWKFDAPMAGRLIPQFFDKFTNCITRPRLHTSLLYLDPVKIKVATEKYFAQFPDTPFNPRPNLINPMFHPVRADGVVRNYFHDTCSLLYHAIGGERFTPEQLDHYDHLQFGTLSDIVAPHYPNYNQRMWHFMVFDNPSLLKGQWRKDDAFYAQAAA